MIGALGLDLPDRLDVLPGHRLQPRRRLLFAIETAGADAVEGLIMPQVVCKRLVARDDPARRMHQEQRSRGQLGRAGRLAVGEDSVGLERHDQAREVARVVDARDQAVRDRVCRRQGCRAEEIADDLGIGHAQVAGQPRDGRRVEQGDGRDALAELLLEQVSHDGRLDRAAAKLEEVIVDADLVPAQDLLPELD